MAVLQGVNTKYTSDGTRSRADTVLIIVESFTTAIEYSAPLRQKLLYSLSTNVLAEPLGRFLDLTRNPQLRVKLDNEDASPIGGRRHLALPSSRSSCPGDRLDHECPYHVERRIKLHQKICTLFLKTALLSQQDTVSLDTSLGSALLDGMVAQLARLACYRYSKVKCSRKPAPVAIFETGSTPNSTGHSDRWTERIKIDLAHNADHQYQTIVRTMRETCHDLERRCNEVEGPLREEQTKSRQLYDELEVSKARVAELEGHNQEQSLFLDGIEHEKSELMKHVRSLENECEGLSSQVEGLREELDVAAQKAEDATQCGKDKANELELLHAAAIVEKDETLEVQHHLERELKIKLERLEASAADMSAKAMISGKELARLEAMTVDRRTALNQANMTIDEKQAECKEYKDLVDLLEIERSDLRSQVN